MVFGGSQQFGFVAYQVYSMFRDTDNRVFTLFTPLYSILEKEKSQNIMKKL